MKNVRIYCKSKSLGQSGQAGCGEWIIEAERSSSQYPEPVMGWTQTGDTLNEIKMQFPSQEKAEAFAKLQGWRYTVSKQNTRKVTPRNYGDNFVYSAEE